MKQAVWLGTLVSTEAAIVSNFLLNNFWSFAHKKVESKGLSYVWNFLKFNLVSSGSVIIQTVGLQILSNIFGKEHWYIYKVVIIFFVIIPYSYILYNKFIWKDKK
jgi:dolichol-phosphate mannosyltransferase